MADGFWIYETQRPGDHQVVVHHASCAQCQGVKRGPTGTGTGVERWDGPYMLRSQAEALARSTGGRVRLCECVSAYEGSWWSRWFRVGRVLGFVLLMVLASSIVRSMTGSDPAVRPVATPVTEAIVETPPTPTLEAGWVLHDRPDAGFAIALPSTWTLIDWDRPSQGDFIRKLKETNPEMAQ